MAKLRKLVLTLRDEDGKVVCRHDIAVGSDTKLARESERWHAVADAAAAELRSAKPMAVSYRLKMVDF